MKKVWMWNHYGSDMYINKGGRHYSFAENLVKQGYKPTVFCANTFHTSNGFIDTGKDKYTKKYIDNIPFVFVKTFISNNNGIDRVKNMSSFFLNLFPVVNAYLKDNEKPDVIIASSVHPLTLVAGIIIAKKLKVPCICEIRDLWPESLYAYGSLKKNSLVGKVLLLLEKWIYENADQLIFTMEGGKDYIVDRKWDIDSGGKIELEKVNHINNGVDIEKFNFNRKTYTLQDEDLDDENSFKVIYTGSIRKVNNLRHIVDVAEKIQNDYENNIKFIIYGDGNERELLERHCERNNINNIVFKGQVQKKYIPFILSKSNLNIMHFDNNSVKKYGASLNKLFEYLASGKPIISDCKFGYDLILKYQAGAVVDNGTTEEMSQKIFEICNYDSEKYNQLCLNSLKASRDYDFMNLTNQLINVINR